MFQKFSKSVTRTRKWIFDAFMSLLGRKKYDDINISSIAEEAGVARQSLYRNFTSKNDIVYKYIQTLFDNFEHKVIDYQHEGRTDVLEFYLLFFDSIYENREEFLKLNQAELTYMLFGSLWEYRDRIDSQIQDGKLNELVKYETGGIVVMTASWIEKGMNSPPDEMAKLAMQFTGSVDPDYTIVSLLKFYMCGDE